MVVTVVSVCLIALIFAIEWTARRNVKKENACRLLDYELLRAKARRDHSMPPVPPNMLVRR